MDQEPHAFAANGTLPSEFQAIAEVVLEECAGSLPYIETLAVECIKRAITRCPDNVGWPMDVWIVKSGADRCKTQTRLDAPRSKVSYPPTGEAPEAAFGHLSPPWSDPKLF